MQKQLIREQFRKRVARSGNSGAVWVPKDWLGEEIVVMRLATPKLSLKEELLHILLPHLSSISAIFLYGSYARNEETKDSDIDVLIVAHQKFSLKPVQRFDITVIEHAKLHDSVQKNPFLYALVHEAKPLMNSVLLEELRQIQPHFKSFIIWYKETTKDSIASSKELLDLDKLESDYLTSYSVLYSLFLRLRGVFLLQSLLHKKTFSNASFKQFMTKHISLSEFMTAYTVYKKVRDHQKIATTTIPLFLPYKLLELLQQELRRLHD